MEGAVMGVFGLVQGKKRKAVIKSSLLEEIETVRLRYDAVASHFETQSDPDLVEASIYEMKSLSARYRYLLGQARKEGVTKSTGHILEHLERL